jgi:serine/threonine-protein kinase
VDHRTDLYSVGAILYEMLTARTPYTADSGEYTEILFKIFTTDPAPIKSFRPDLPDGLAAAVHRALTRDLAQRFGSAVDMAEALAPYSDERGAGIISRMRGTRQASNAPGPGSGMAVIPSNVGARATPAEATARTYTASAASVAPGAVPTDVGVTRESPSAQPGGPPTKTRRAVFVVAAAVSLLVGAAGVIVVKTHASSTGAGAGPEAPAPSVKPAASATMGPPSSPGVRATRAVPTLPSTAESPSASASASAKPAVHSLNQPPAPAVAPVLPKQLGDVKFH